eukprot:m.138764 g.138764  ORF g.138764 m.138764 type:complete len:66 (+) comp15923_c0_seq4:495-692(+)
MANKFSLVCPRFIVVDVDVLNTPATCSDQGKTTTNVARLNNHQPLDTYSKHRQEGKQKAALAVAT